MKKTEKIIKYASQKEEFCRVEQIKQQSAETVNYFSIAESNWRSIKEKLTWLSLEPIEQQKLRITTLARSIRLDWDYSKIENAINIFDIINLSLPYVKVMKNFPEIEQLCCKELDLLEEGGRFFEGKHVTKEEIDFAFKRYNEYKDFKNEALNVCHDKIDNLYVAFNKFCLADD